VKRYTYILFILSSVFAYAQDDINGPELPDLTVLDMFITETGDTLFMADLPMISVTSSSLYLDMSKYRRMDRHARKVYPYAQKATALLSEIERETELIEKKRHQKKYLKKLEKELKDQFKEELKNLTTSQGKILVKMIERDTGEPFFNTLKSLKNPVTAFLFQKIGKRFGYDLKQGYDADEDWMLEKIILKLEQENADSADVSG